MNCITECEVISDLLRPGLLRTVYNNYRAYHGETIMKNLRHHYPILLFTIFVTFYFAVTCYPDAYGLQPNADLSQAEINTRINAQRRLSAYRSLVFWTYPDIRTKDRRPLPSCTYAMVRAVYPSTEDEEIWADLQHTVFIAFITRESDFTISYSLSGNTFVHFFSLDLCQPLRKHTIMPLSSLISA